MQKKNNTTVLFYFIMLQINVYVNVLFLSEVEKQTHYGL